MENLSTWSGSRRARWTLLGAVGAFLIVVTALGWATLDGIRARVLADTANTLRAVLGTTVETLDIWITQKKDYLAEVAADARLRALIERQVAVGRAPDSLLAGPALAEIREDVAARGERFGDMGFLVLAPDLVTVAASEDAVVGTVPALAHSRPDLVKKALEGEVVFVPPIRTEAPGAESGDVAMYFVAPIRDDHASVVAVLAQRVDHREDFTRITALGRVGASGETYVFDATARILSQSRFDKQLRRIGLLRKGQPGIGSITIRDPGGNLLDGHVPALPREQQPLTVMAASALRGESGVDTGGYRDYRGVPVVGAWRWDEGLGFGMTTEVDVAQALAPYRAARNAIVLMLGVTALLAIGLSALTVVTGARANRALQRSRELLEQRVRERTAELAQSEGRLKTVVDNMPAVVCLRDREGRFTLINRGYERAYGVAAESVRGATLHAVFPSDDAERFAAHDREVIVSGEPVEREYVITHDGAEHIYHAIKFPIRDPDGEVVAVGGVEIDRTEARQQQRELAEKSRILEATLENMAQGITMFDPDLNIIAWNSAFARLLEISEDRLKAGASFEDLIRYNAERGEYGEHEVDEIVRSRLALARRFEPHHFERVRPDGTVLEVRGNPVPGGGFVTTYADITERKRAERELRKLSRAIEESPAAVVITDAEGVIEYVNPKFEAVTGYPASEVLGNTPRLLKSGYQSDDYYRELWQTISSGNEWHGEMRNRKKSGEVFWEHVHISPLRDADGVPTHYVAVKEDIDERKHMEQELIEAKVAADAASRAKSEFLANMSHEIRTPMNAVIGMTHLALKTELTSRQRDYLLKIQSSANALLGIINDILDVSKIEAGRLELEHVEFKLDDVLDNVSTVIGHPANQKGLEILFQATPDVPQTLVGDPLRLGQILINLGTNAVKFTEAGEIVFRCERRREREGRIELELSVRDTGIGMTQEQAGRLFQAFSQADTSTTRRYGGTGLGLSICKQLVEMMDGEIRVDSEPGAGSTFTFTIWLGISNRERPATTLSPDLRGLRVLVVDDNDTAREVLSEALEAFSFRTTAVASAEEALRELESCEGKDGYGLVLMDWRMPGMDGIEATRHIKHDGRLARVPAVIMVTAFGREEVRQQAEEAGADALLLKPVNRSLLMDALMEVFDAGPREGATVRHAAVAAPVLDGVLEGLRVLVVEDNEVNQQVARELLEGAGVTVTIARNGRDAVDRLGADGAQRPDAVLMDLQMPVMDGLEATRRIRAQARFADLPVIAMTAHALEEERERCLAAGMNDHVTKPIDPDVLFGALARWTGRAANDAPRVAGRVARATDEAAASLEISGFDVEGGLRRLAGNRQLYLQLLEKFARTQAGEASRDARAAMERGDREAAKRVAHSIKGVAGNLGARAAHESAGALERALREEAGADPDRALETFVEALAAARHVIEQTLAADTSRVASADEPGATAGGPRSGADDLQALEPQLAELRRLLADYDAGAVDCLESMRDRMPGGRLAGSVRELEERVRGFDFEEAIASLDALAGKLRRSPD